MAVHIRERAEKLSVMDTLLVKMIFAVCIGDAPLLARQRSISRVSGLSETSGSIQYVPRIRINVRSIYYR